jgi:hypothetical protein
VGFRLFQYKIGSTHQTREQFMEPIFSLPYSEFCVAQQLASHFPAGQGYSLYAPISRQQPGVDLMLARRRGRRMQVACIQVKSSRTCQATGETDPLPTLKLTPPTNVCSVNQREPATPASAHRDLRSSMMR